ncbi:MAG TPA: cytochrome P450 [Acidimicrobiales bacterium]|nr:cytochrome P450 [Acidimicrobiales bacterium]
MTDVVTDPQSTNFFRDRAVQDDPYAFFDALRERAPVWQEPNYGVYMVTGYEEALAVYNDAVSFSSCNAVSGPFVPFSVPLEGDDVGDIIDRHRDELPFSDQLPTFDPPRHHDHRRLLMRLLTPQRLRENEEFMWRQADVLMDGFLPAGRCEFIGSYAEPFTLLVIADLEGVPESDHGLFRDHLSTMAGQLEHKPLEFLYEQFTAYIEDRRRNPRDDIMTAMATATFPDGATPEVNDVALLAANLFAGGQETTVRLLSFALRTLAERPDLQQRLRDDRDRIPNFIEEQLRVESPLRGQFRMARTEVTVGGVGIPAGGTVLVLPGAANRDPRTFPDPAVFDVDRANARLHIAFGHGIHHCAGAHLARAEGRVTINRILDRTSDIRISEEEHGPPGDRRYGYLPTYFLRGLTRLHLEVTPA